MGRKKGIAGDSPLIIAIGGKFGHLAPPQGKWGPMHWAARDGDLAKIREIAKRDPSAVNQRGYDGWTPLHMAALNQRLDVVNLLIELDADVSARCDKGSTPLHVAVIKDSPSVAFALIARGASIEIKDYFDMTALDRLSDERRKPLEEAARQRAEYDADIFEPAHS